MQVGLNTANFGYHGVENRENENRFKDGISNLSAQSITNSYFLEFQNQSFNQSGINFSAQSALNFYNPTAQNAQNLSDILKGIDYAAIGYDGKEIGSLTQDEASSLVSENGFFGITNTANRIADFVISGAGDDLDRLQAGREGVLRGFEEAERLWGDNLPEISQQTMQRALESIDQRIAKLGGNVLNVQA